MGDAREGAAWSRGQRWKNDALYVVIRVLVACLAPLPRGALRTLGRGVGMLAWLALPRERRVARSNLAIAFPSATARDRARLLLRAYVTLGAHLGDAVAMLDAKRAIPALPIDDVDLALLRDPRGVVFASAHLGPWEQLAATLRARGAPLTAVARESYDPRLDVLYARLREDRGVPAIYRGKPGAAARIVRVLRRGEALGIPMDLRSRVASVDAPFFDRDAKTPVGPARIALRTRARVVVGTVAPDPRVDGGLRITCTPIATDDLAKLDGATAERVLTARINAELSARIRALPAHWPWMHDRFARPSRRSDTTDAPIADDAPDVSDVATAI